MVIEQEAAGQGPEQKVRKRALLFELEYVAMNGRQLRYDALKSVLKSQRIDLTPVLFSRYLLSGPLTRCLDALCEGLGKDNIDTGELAAKANDKILSAYGVANPKLDPKLEAVFKADRKHGAGIGALSELDDQHSREIAQSLGLDAFQVVVQAGGLSSGGSADGWPRVARALNVSPMNGVVLSTHGSSCRAALDAHMRCVVVPDAFTSFQDFAGADYVLDELDAKLIGEMLEPAS